MSYYEWYYDKKVIYWSLKSTAIELGGFVVSGSLSPHLPNTFVNDVCYMLSKTLCHFVFSSLHSTNPEYEIKWKNIIKVQMMFCL